MVVNRAGLGWAINDQMSVDLANIVASSVPSARSCAIRKRCVCTSPAPARPARPRARRQARQRSSLLGLVSTIAPPLVYGYGPNCEAKNAIWSRSTGAKCKYVPPCPGGRPAACGRHVEVGLQRRRPRPVAHRRAPCRHCRPSMPPRQRLIPVQSRHPLPLLTKERTNRDSRCRKHDCERF